MLKILHTRFLRIVAGASLAIATLPGLPAGAATLALPTSGNLTDHWWIPSESGWGLYLTQQDRSVLFGILFVYDATGRAHWFVMPDMRRANETATAYSGALYSTAGSPVGTAYNPAAMASQQRGTATITPLPDGRATLRYTVDGTTIEKTIQRMGVTDLPIVGAYSVRLSANVPPGCNGVAVPDREIWTITRTPSGYELARAAYGETATATRSLQVQMQGVTAIATFGEQSPPNAGTWALVLDRVEDTALIGKFAFIDDSPAGGCAIQGSFAAARGFPSYRLEGALDAQWWDPAEPGWGLSVSHGTFGLFAILFHYSSEVRDAQGRGLAQWYVMPEMTKLPWPGGPPSPEPLPPGYRGTIYATQGTPFSQPYNASAVTMTPVGEATLGDFTGDVATLTYRIGTQTTTRQVRRYMTANPSVLGAYRVSMNTNISPCTQRLTLDETWNLERADDGGILLTRMSAAGELLGVRERVQVAYPNRLTQLTFQSMQDGTMRNWTINLTNVGPGGMGGAFGRSMLDGTCFANGTFAAARLP